MPTLNLITNVKITDAKDFVLEFTKFGAKTLGQPEAYISAIITYNETFSFGGTFDPAISLRVEFLDNINREANERYSKAFFDYFQQRLGVSGNRGYITFVDPGRENLGHDGTTFAIIFGEK